MEQLDPRPAPLAAPRTAREPSMRLARGARALGAALVAATCVAPHARAFDILPPGSRRVTHTLEIAPSPVFDAYDLYAAPTAGFSGHTRIEPGVAFTFSSKYGTRIHALAKGTPFPEVAETPPAARARLAAVSVASADVPVSEVHSVSLASPIESAHTRLAVRGVENGVLQLEVLEHHEAWSTTHGAVLAALAGAGAIGLVVMVRARRRARAADRDANGGAARGTAGGA